MSSSFEIESLLSHFEFHFVYATAHYMACISCCVRRTWFASLPLHSELLGRFLLSDCEKQFSCIEAHRTFVFIYTLHEFKHTGGIFGNTRFKTSQWLWSVSRVLLRVGRGFAIGRASLRNPIQSL